MILMQVNCDDTIDNAKAQEEGALQRLRKDDAPKQAVAKP